VIDLVRDPRFRIRLALGLLAICLVCWPLSALTWARAEPPTVLHLSWGAMFLAALNILATADVRRQQEDDEA
jgi:hypothetical protein